MSRGGTPRRRTCARAGCRHAASRVDAVADRSKRRSARDRGDSSNRCAATGAARRRGASEERRQPGERCRFIASDSTLAIGVITPRPRRPRSPGRRCAPGTRCSWSDGSARASGLPIASRPKPSFAAERHERGRADLDRAGAEQEVALAVADLAAARPGRIRTAFRTSSARARSHRSCADDGCRCCDSADLARRREQQQPFGRAEVFAQRCFQRIQQRGGVACAHQAAGEAMDLCGEHVVAARHVDQLAQPRFERLDSCRAAPAPGARPARPSALPRLCGSFSLVSSAAWRSKKSGLRCR